MEIASENASMMSIRKLGSGTTIISTMPTMASGTVNSLTLLVVSFAATVEATQERIARTVPRVQALRRLRAAQRTAEMTRPRGFSRE